MPPSRALRGIRSAARAVPLRVPLDSPWRDGLPLPALTAGDATTQLVWRVLGPLPARVTPILEWVSTGRAADWSDGMIGYWTGFVRLAGRRTPLQPPAGAELTDPGRLHPVAVRQRSLFGLPEPSHARGRPSTPGVRITRNARSAVRLLTAVGPLTITDLVDAHHRARQYRSDELLSADDLALGLTYLGAGYDPTTATWSAPAGAEATDADRQLLAALPAGQDYRRRDLVTALIEAGLSASTAHNRVAWSPLIQKAGDNRYRTRSPAIGQHRDP